MKSQDFSKKNWQIKFKWLASHKRLVVVIGVILSGILIIGLSVFLRSDKSEVAKEGTKLKSSKVSIQIDSNISGVAMSGTPYCGSDQLGQQTPYVCELPETKTETTITAPANAVSQGNAYLFKTWDGCSESNADKKVCKVKSRSGDKKIIKATYEVAPTSNNLSDTTVASCPIASKYIVAGPQAFTPETPERLVLYNLSANYTKPTNAQLWNGKACKEITLTKGLIATKGEGLSYGFGFAESAYITTTSERTTVPPGGHSYLAVVDEGRRHYLIAVVRDDGTVVIDENSLAKMSGATAADMTSSEPWLHFGGWQDSHTLHINVNSSSNGGCYIFDVDAGTYAIDNSGQCFY